MSDADDNFTPNPFHVPPGLPPVLINAVGDAAHAEKCKAEFKAWQAEQKRKRQEQRKANRTRSNLSR